MKDWDGNGKYDAVDNYIDYKLSGGDKYTGHKRKNSDESGCGVLIYIFFTIIMMAAVPVIGLIMIGALIWFWMCGGI